MMLTLSCVLWGSLMAYLLKNPVLPVNKRL